MDNPTINTIPPELIDIVLQFLPTKTVFGVVTRLNKSLSACAIDHVKRHLSVLSAAEFANHLVQRRRISQRELEAIVHGAWNVEKVAEAAHLALEKGYSRTDLSRLFTADFESWYLKAQDKTQWWNAISRVFEVSPLQRAHLDFVGGPLQMAPIHLSVSAGPTCQWFFLELAETILGKEGMESSLFSWDDFTAQLSTYVFQDKLGDPFPRCPFLVPLMIRAAVGRWFGPECEETTSMIVSHIEEELRRAKFWWEHDRESKEHILFQVAIALMEAGRFNGFQVGANQIANTMSSSKFFVDEVLKGHSVSPTHIGKIVEIASTKLPPNTHFWHVCESPYFTARISDQVNKLCSQVQKKLGADALDLYKRAPNLTRRVLDPARIAQEAAMFHLDKLLPPLLLETPVPSSSANFDDFVRGRRHAFCEQQALEATLATVYPQSYKSAAQAFVKQLKPGSQALDQLKRMLGYLALHHALQITVPFQFSELFLQYLRLVCFAEYQLPKVPEVIAKELIQFVKDKEGRGSQAPLYYCGKCGFKRHQLAAYQQLVRHHGCGERFINRRYLL